MYAHACKLKGAQCFQLRISLPEVTGHSTSSTPVNLNALPEDYHNFADMFSKSKAEKLAEHQPYNLKITLDEGTICHEWFLCYPNRKYGTRKGLESKGFWTAASAHALRLPSIVVQLFEAQEKSEKYKVNCFRKAEGF